MSFNVVTATRSLSVMDMLQLSNLRSKYGANQGASLKHEQNLAARFKIPTTDGHYRIVLVPANAHPSQLQKMHLQWYPLSNPTPTPKEFP